MICPKCNTRNPDGTLNCSQCGALLPSSDPFDSLSGMKTTMASESAGSSLKKGELFAGRYEILEDGMKGGMGMVYKVKDKTLGKISALKIILPEYLQNGKAVSRFKQEVAITLELLHENIVRVYDIGESEGMIFFTMEWIDGISMRDYINGRKKQNNRLSLEEGINLIKQICSALGYAHKTIIHRDIKPENILIINPFSKDPKIKITDFGIAKMESQTLHVSASSYVGTPIYMAPEQYTDASHADKRADIYSIGAVLYELLTFLHPLGTFPMPSEVNPSLPKKVDSVIKKALSADKAKRYDDAMDIMKALEMPSSVEEKVSKTAPIQERTTVTSPPASTPGKKKSMMLPVAAGIIFLILTGVGYKFLSPAKHESPQTAISGGQEKPADAPIGNKPATRGYGQPAGKPVETASLPAQTPTAVAPGATIPAETPYEQDENVPFELQVNILGQRQIGSNDYEEVAVRNGSTMKSNDNLQIHLRTTRDCYIYVLMFDSAGKASMLFPGMGGTNNRIKGNRIYSIPAGNDWFFLDESTGTETIYVLADVSPMTDIDRLLADMEHKGSRQQKDDSQKILTQVAFLKRGIGGTSAGKPMAFKTSDGDTISNVSQVVKGRGSLVWSVSFKHI